MADHVFLRNIRLQVNLGKDRWGRRGKLQPVDVSIRFILITALVGTGDDLKNSLDYGKIYRLITSQVDNKEFEWFDSPLDALNALLPNDVDYDLELVYPAAILRAERVTASTSFKRNIRDGFFKPFHYIGVERMRAHCIIGLNEHERLAKQTLIISVSMPIDEVREDLGALADAIVELVEKSSYFTIEKVAEEVATFVLKDHTEVKVSVEKPHAYANAEGPGIDIFRRRPNVPIF